MTELQFSDPYQLAKYIKEANKQTPVKVYLNGDLSTCSSETLKILGLAPFTLLLETVKK